MFAEHGSTSFARHLHRQRGFRRLRNAWDAGESMERQQLRIFRCNNFRVYRVLRRRGRCMDV